MTTPVGQIKASDIVSEFGSSSGSSNNISMGAYRVSQTIAGRSWSLDEGVPSSGSISFSQLQGKTLNVVVDYSGADEFRVDASTKYSNGTVVGGFKTLPTRTGVTQTKKVINVIRKTIGAETDSSGQATALRTGSWDSSTTLLKFIISSSGEIIGAGGKGGDMDQTVTGNGTFFTATGTLQNGQPGTHAFGASVNCEVIVESGGRIQGGGGGGTAGQTGASNPNDNQWDPYADGGAGGGGAGWPVGEAGLITRAKGGGRYINASVAASNGNPGTKYIGGDGGTGRAGDATPGFYMQMEAGGGGGGGGPTPGNGSSNYFSKWPTSAGSNGSSTQGGDGGNLNSDNFFRGAATQKGTPGSNGSAIIRSGSSITVTLQNSGTLFGATNTVGIYT